MTTVYLDTETTGLDPRTDRLVAVGFAIDDSPVFVLLHDRDRAVVQRVLELDAVFVGHHVGFDLHFLEANGYRLPDPERWQDTQIVAHVAGKDGERLAGNTALADLTKRLIGLELLDPDVLTPEREIKRWLSAARTAATKRGQSRPQLGDAPAELLQPYLRADVVQTRAVARHYGPRVNGQASVLELEHRCLPAVHATERRGVPVDVEAAHTIRTASAAKLLALRERAFELAGKPFPLRSHVEIEQALIRRGVDAAVLRRTSTNKLAIAKQALEEIDDELPRVLLEYAAELKFNGILLGLLGSVRDGRIHSSFHQLGTITGRMSSGNPNVQNLPKTDLRVRYLIAAGEGKTLVRADQSIVELRVLACYARGGALEGAFRAGVDVHQQTADALDIPRDAAKTINFAMTYGGGVPLIASKLDIERDEARVVLDRYFRLYPEIRALQRALERAVRRRGYLTTIGGRRHWFDRPSHMLINRLVSGGAADLFKRAVTELHHAGVPMILLVHDEIVAEAPVEDAARIGALLERELARGARRGGTVIDGLVAEASTAHRWSDFREPGWTPEPAAPAEEDH